MLSKEKYPFLFFLCLLLGTGYLAVQIALPYIMIFVWSILLVTCFNPWYKRLLGLLRGRAPLAALLMVLLLTLLLIIPAAVVVVAIANQSVDAYEAMVAGLEARELDSLDKVLELPSVQKAKDFLGNYVNLAKFNPKTAIASGLEHISSFLVELSKNVFSSVAGFVFNFLLLLVVTYNLFKYGPNILNMIRRLSPLETEKENRILQKFVDVTQVTMLGNFVTALVQGILGGIGFLIAGLPSPLLWGTVMAFCSMLPVVGTTLVWGPAVVYLLVTGRTVAGLFLLVWCGVLVGTSDNVVRPMVIQGRADMNPTVIFFSIMGGLSVFGFSGLILGPVVVAVLFVLVQIYKEEFQDQLDAGVKDGSARDKTLTPDPQAHPLP